MLISLESLVVTSDTLVVTPKVQNPAPALATAMLVLPTPSEDQWISAARLMDRCPDSASTDADVENVAKWLGKEKDEIRLVLEEMHISRFSDGLPPAASSALETASPGQKVWLLCGASFFVQPGGVLPDFGKLLQAHGTWGIFFKQKPEQRMAALCGLVGGASEEWLRLPTLLKLIRDAEIRGRAGRALTTRLISTNVLRGVLLRGLGQEAGQPGPDEEEEEEPEHDQEEAGEQDAASDIEEAGGGDRPPSKEEVLHMQHVRRQWGGNAWLSGAAGLWTTRDGSQRRKTEADFVNWVSSRVGFLRAEFVQRWVAGLPVGALFSSQRGAQKEKFAALGWGAASGLLLFAGAPTLPLKPLKADAWGRATNAAFMPLLRRAAWKLRRTLPHTVHLTCEVRKFRNQVLLPKAGAVRERFRARFRERVRKGEVKKSGCCRLCCC